MRISSRGHEVSEGSQEIASSAAYGGLLAMTNEENASMTGDEIHMIKALRVTKDILPDEIGLWQYIESTGRDIFNIYGYREIRTPIIEESSLFVRSIGGATDIVQKEMYVFSDRGGRSIALRPEATASIARAYIENSLFQAGGVTKLFYAGQIGRE